MWTLTSLGYHAVLTSRSHQSGTDRIAEANASIGADFVINVQADEPLVTASQIDLLGTLITRGCSMATLAIPFARPEDVPNPNQVKVVVSRRGEALYFSRSPIPFRATWAAFSRRNGCRRMPFTAISASTPTARISCRNSTGCRPGASRRSKRLEQLRALETGAGSRSASRTSPRSAWTRRRTPPPSSAIWTCRVRLERFWRNAGAFRNESEARLRNGSRQGVRRPPSFPPRQIVPRARASTIR